MIDKRSLLIDVSYHLLLLVTTSISSCYYAPCIPIPPLLPLFCSFPVPLATTLETGKTCTRVRWVGLDYYSDGPGAGVHSMFTCSHNACFHRHIIPFPIHHHYHSNAHFVYPVVIRDLSEPPQLVRNTILFATLRARSLF
jgi:hypothetical protein